MAAQGSDGEEDFVTYGKGLELFEEGDRPKRPIPLQDQTVKDEKGRYQRFHGAFTGGFSAGYYNTVGSKEGWAPSTFISSRQGRSEKQVRRPEDFMDEEDLGEFGIAPNEIMTTDDFASKAKDRIKEKARQLASVTAPIPGATILEDLIAPAKITIGVQLLRQMGWKEGQGLGPRTKRKARQQKPESSVKLYGCALPPAGSEGSEDEEDEYLPENVTFAPKDVIPIDFTIKDNVHGLGYRGLDPNKALFGSQDTHISLFGDGSDKTSNLLGTVRHGKGRKVGISGQAFGVGALEDEDDDIYGTESLSKYDTVVREEESGDGLFGWTAPKEYKSKKGLAKELQTIGKILEGFCIAAKSSPSKKIYSPPELPRDYRPVHYFKPVLTTGSHISPALQALLDSAPKPSPKPVIEQPPPQSRHHLSSSQRREMLGETALPGPASLMELLSDKDQERIKDLKRAAEQQKVKATNLAQEALKSRFQPTSAEETQTTFKAEVHGGELVPAPTGEFRPFETNPEKQQRYENYVRHLHKGQKDVLESCLDHKMTEWERGRERDEFMRSAMLYKPSNSTLASRFARAKHEDDSDKVEVPRDQENDVNDKAAAVKMKMFGKLTRDTFEWHPDKLLCKRFNIPDPYPGSTIIGLPKVKRDKYSIFNFLTVPETPKPNVTSPSGETAPQHATGNKPKKPSRWDVSAEDKKDSISEFLSQARTETDQKQTPQQSAEKDCNQATAALATKVVPEHTDHVSEEEEKRPPIDLFKAIFADSSDEKSSSSEGESEEEEEGSQVILPDVASIEPVDPPETTLSSVQEPNPGTNEPAPCVLTAVKIEETVVSEEEFGPKLPPVLSSSTPGMSYPAQLPSADEPAKKQKHKRSKEKHKLKKEHKHKKEKKKKHKKQKHKNKHRSKKAEENSSSETDASSGSPSGDKEQTVEITPKELLKRLKNLPIPR
ncbi:G patch domain-containing protein 1 isoform X1 [Ascaphus truei]|uniref:G patch domain-containing protein 1 isoform X1 n=1 Tax=Ascaphus truei TaxID=8439 RepID=UPI003F59B3C4